MDEKRICKKCKKEYDPAYDFIEEIELLEALNYFIDIENHCSLCLYDLRDRISDSVNHFVNN